MNKENIDEVLMGRKMVDIATGEELSYYSYTDEKILLLDEKGLTIWLPFERVILK